MGLQKNAENIVGRPHNQRRSVEKDGERIMSIEGGRQEKTGLSGSTS